MRIVVKVGTSTLAYPTGRLNIQRMERLCKVLSDLKNAGTRDHSRLLRRHRHGRRQAQPVRAAPRTCRASRRAAAVGQCELMYIYDKLFTEYNHIVGAAPASPRRTSHDGGSRKANFHNTIDAPAGAGRAARHQRERHRLHRRRSPSATMTRSPPSSPPPSGADLLVLLSDIDGLYDARPAQKPRREADPHRRSCRRANLRAWPAASGPSLGTGGMVTKLARGADRRRTPGCEMVIANGEAGRRFCTISSTGKPIGTRFLRKEGTNMTNAGASAEDQGGAWAALADAPARRRRTGCFWPWPTAMEAHATRSSPRTRRTWPPREGAHLRRHARPAAARRGPHRAPWRTASAARVRPCPTIRAAILARSRAPTASSSTRCRCRWASSPSSMRAAPTSPRTRRRLPSRAATSACSAAERRPTAQRPRHRRGAQGRALRRRAATPTS